MFYSHKKSYMDFITTLHTYWQHYVELHTNKHGFNSTSNFQLTLMDIVNSLSNQELNLKHFISFSMLYSTRTIMKNGFY